LWRKSLTGEIEQWIELGQPDEQRIRKACGRARQVVVDQLQRAQRRCLVGQDRGRPCALEKTSP